MNLETAFNTAVIGGVCVAGASLVVGGVTFWAGIASQGAGAIELAHTFGMTSAGALATTVASVGVAASGAIGHALHEPRP